MTWDELSAASLDEILAWASDQPWAQAMADCQQDAGWHSEGDVWTHTKLVCAQLPQIGEWPSLTPQEQMVLISTALFHDAAKPLTSHVDPEAGRITSPKHAIKGEHLARSALRDVGCPLAIREQITRMVRFHGRPAFLLERASPAHEVVSLSWLATNKLLFLFALADTRGRNTSETSRPEENLHLWKLVAEENGCFDRPYPFANDQARFLFYRQREPDLHYVTHEDYRCTAGESPQVQHYIDKYLWLGKLRLPQFAKASETWWREEVPFFGGLRRQRIWVFWRRVLHTCHHRTQVQTWLRLAGQHVPAIYGPSGDETWSEADPTYSVDAAGRG